MADKKVIDINTGFDTIDATAMDLSDIALTMVRVKVPIVGLTPLICNAWSQKAIGMIKRKQAGEAKKQREKRKPKEEYQSSLYPFPSGGYGVKANAMKAAMVAACRQVPELKMTQMKGAFHILGSDGSLTPDSMLQILTPDLQSPAEPRPREDMVRLESGVADIRYRAEFLEWALVVTMQFEKDAVSVKQMLNLLQRAGVASGLGEWRPSAPKSHNGVCGMFQIATTAQAKEKVA